jgi:hypothetical protein
MCRTPLLLVLSLLLSLLLLLRVGRFILPSRVAEPLIDCNAEKQVNIITNDNNTPIRQLRVGQFIFVAKPLIVTQLDAR